MAAQSLRIQFCSGNVYSLELQWSLLKQVRYGSLSTRRVDLVGDYAGQELFLVEGDSLLLRCFSDSRLDFDRQ